MAATFVRRIWRPSKIEESKSVYNFVYKNAAIEVFICLLSWWQEKQFNLAQVH